MNLVYCPSPTEEEEHGDGLPGPAREADYSPIRERCWPGAVADLAPLTAGGSQQSMHAARQLATAGATAIVSSPMTRALQTAAIIGVHLGLKVEVDFDLREWLPDDTFSWRDLKTEALGAAGERQPGPARSGNAKITPCHVPTGHRGSSPRHPDASGPLSLSPGPLWHGSLLAG
jgi:hypothetical protein